jgi:hypothetical protein
MNARKKKLRKFLPQKIILGKKSKQRTIDQMARGNKKRKQGGSGSAGWSRTKISAVRENASFRC